MTEQDILSLVDDQEVVELTRRLVMIPSENPPGEEGRVSEFIADWLRARDIPVRVVEAEKRRPNLIASYGPEAGPTFMLNGHTDVVPPGDGWTVDPYGGELRDGRVYGRGSTDMKGGLAAMMCALEAIQKSRVQLKGRLLLVFTADEEAGGTAGARHLVDSGQVSADSCLVCEPSSLMLVTSEGGLVWLELTVTGRSVHSVMAAEGVNAVEKTLELLDDLKPLKEKVESGRGIQGKRGVFSVNLIRGGVKVNQVPGECRVSIDVRIPYGLEISPRDVIEELQAILEKRSQKDPEFRASLSYREPVMPFQIPPESEIIACLREAVHDVTNSPARDWAPQKMIKTDDSDLYHWWTRGGIPGVYFGPGAIELAHNADEYVEVKELRLAARIFALVALRTLGWST